MTERFRVQEVIVVEGIHDKQAVDRAVQADCLISGGSSCGEAFLRQVERAAAERGVIILTDPDTPGARIRRIVSERVPNCKHAFLPKKEAIRDGDLGIENANPESIRLALLGARAQVLTSQEQSPLIQWEDVIELGLVGLPDSSRKREQLGDLLGIGYGNAKTFWKRLHSLRITPQEFAEAYEKMENRERSRSNE